MNSPIFDTHKQHFLSLLPTISPNYQIGEDIKSLFLEVIQGFQLKTPIENMNLAMEGLGYTMVNKHVFDAVYLDKKAFMWNVNRRFFDIEKKAQVMHWGMFVQVKKYFETILDWVFEEFMKE